MPAAAGLAERLHRDARPQRRRLPPRPVRRDGAGRPPLPARQPDGRDDVADPHRLAARPRCAVHGPVAQRRRAVPHASPVAHRLRRRALPAAHGEMRQRLGRPVDDLRAGLRLRPGRADVELRGRRLRRDRRRPPRAPTSRCGSRPTCGRASRARGCTRGPGWSRATAISSRSPGRRCRRRGRFDEAKKRLRRTQEYWRQWITLGDFPDHPWRSYLQRSALTLKGLTYAPTGALLAAATTSLPETPAGRAQLGLPLRLGARLDLRAVGSLHPGLRPGGRRLLLLHRRRLPRRRRRCR